MIFQPERMMFSFIATDSKAQASTLHNTSETLVRPDLMSENCWKMWYARSSVYLPNPSGIINSRTEHWKQTADARNQKVILLMVIPFGLMIRDKCLSDLFLQIPK